MDNQFQDRIDEYLLHGDQMKQEEKASFLKEIEENAEKKEQYELTVNVRKALTSRGEKLKAMKEFEQSMRCGQVAQSGVAATDQQAQEATRIPRSKRSGRKLWLWMSGVAAVLVAGFFSVQMLFTSQTPNNPVRGGDDVFNGAVPVDSIESDTTTIPADTIVSKP